MTKIIGRAGAATLLGSLVLASGATQAQNYPTKPLRLIVPFPAGGPTDSVGRVIATGVAAKVEKPFIVENKPGGGTLIGTEAAAQAVPDGYTFLLMAPSIMTQFPFLIKNYNANLMERLAPVSLATSSTLAMMVHSSVPSKSLNEFIAYARANPGRLNYGNATTGGPQLVHMYIIKKYGLQIAEVNYQGTGQLQPAMLRGEIHWFIGFPAVWKPVVDQGHGRFIAILGEKREKSMPDIPTLGEAGLPEFRGVVFSGYGVMAPAATPKAIVTAMSDWISAAVRTDSAKDQLAKLGMDAEGTTPEEFGARLANDAKFWGMIAKEVNFVAK